MITKAQITRRTAQDEVPAKSPINDNYRGNYERLVQLKKRYDPGNLFRLNANIRPA